MENKSPLQTQQENKYIIELQPAGRRIAVEQGVNLLQAAQRAGVDLVAACSGAGFCGTCRIRLIKGVLTPPSASEVNLLGPQKIEEGFRIACQAEPLSDLQVEIPLSSMPVGQRLQVEGVEAGIMPEPAIAGLDLSLARPKITDLRSDISRVEQALTEKDYPSLSGNLFVLGELSQRLRENDWSVRLAVRKETLNFSLVSTFPKGTPLLGIAADLGSTKLALYLVELETGALLESVGVMNPQIAYGEDVVSRIAFANKSTANRTLLQTRLVETLNQSIHQLCHQADAEPNQIVDAVMVGNTAIHHFFCGLPVKQLGESPYVPVVSDQINFNAAEVGLKIAPGANVYIPAIIAGFVGADHTAAMLSSAMRRDEGVRMLIDIGTNTEISLAVGGHVYTCSTASGPAFEGAHIHDGMRAAPGAIERVKLDGNQVVVSTVDGKPPVGICGTGILSGVAELLDAGVLNRIGNLDESAPSVCRVEGQKAFVLVPAAKTAHGREIVITRGDINEIQLAKGAIRTGIEVLLNKAGLDPDQVEEWIIAGAFGTYLDINSALRIGMFPTVPVDRFHQVGNAAGIGAKQMLISYRKRQEAQQLIQGVEYVELTVYPDFQNLFLEALYY
jgi:uncharacterized 2Fe-2S/4Fe-4S cluster protein (DUF4445 family)